ncbi:DMT family transporter [Lysinibacillus sp. KU-BSD001]|uniref:DMT family transporter n=1 Tax=Lysinibacillus sp. KU-BSD001 TaxID=3141328 RepID=UPI0036EDBF24
MLNKTTKSMKPYLAIIIGVISVSLSAIFVKLASAESGVIAFYRMLFSVLIMSPLFLIKYRHELKLLEKREWLFSSIAGIFLAFHFILWFESLNYTSVASSTVLVTLQPLFAFIGTYIFFKERASFQSIVAVSVALVGSLLIGWGDFRTSGTALYGDILALIACALITGYLLFGQAVRNRLSLMTYTMVVYSVSTICLFIYVLCMGQSFGPYEKTDWFWFVMLAIVPNLLGHTLFNWSLKWVSTNTISIAILFEPVGAAILALFIFNEKLMVSQVVGGSIIMVGIAMFVTDIKKVKSFFEKSIA